MNLWLKCLQLHDDFSNALRTSWYRMRFLLFQKPHHRLVELSDGVKFNVPLRGGLGTLKVGAGVTLGYRYSACLGNGEILVQARNPDSEINIGTGTTLNNNSVVCATRSIHIGERCLIGDGVVIVDSDFHDTNPAMRRSSPGPSEPVRIGNNVWIGSRAMVLKGVSIGENSVIGAKSLVTHDIPPNCIAAGIPAKVIKTI